MPQFEVGFLLRNLRSHRSFENLPVRIHANLVGICDVPKAKFQWPNPYRIADDTYTTSSVRMAFDLLPYTFRCMPEARIEEVTELRPISEVVSLDNLTCYQGVKIWAVLRVAKRRLSHAKLEGLVRPLP